MNNDVIDYAKLSVQDKMIIWYYTSPVDKKKTIYKVPLSKYSAIKYWTEQKNLKLIETGKANNMINKIKRGTDKRFIFLYDFYPEYIDLIDSLIYSVSIICYEKNVKRDVGSRYMQTINRFIKFIDSKNYHVKKISNLTVSFQKELIFFIESENEYLSQEYDRKNLIEIINKVLTNHDMTNVINSRIFLPKNKKRYRKSSPDISQEVLVQLLASAVKDINNYISRVKQLNIWRKEYNGKIFDSLENIACAYYNYPDYYNSYKKKSKNASIVAHRKKYNKMAIEKYNIDLNKLEKKELVKISEDGHNINNLIDPFIMAWFFDDVLENFPFNNGNNYVYTNTPMCKYTRFNYLIPVKSYIKPHNKSYLPYKAIFDDILSRKYPSSEEIFPFILFWMIQTGSNIEVVLNMKNKENINQVIYEIGDYFIEEDTVIIKSYKNRGTGLYYYALDKKEKNGLYDYLLFLKKALKPLWEYKKTDSFWVYTASQNIAHGNIVNFFNRYTMKSALKKFLSKHKILDQNGNELLNLDLRRIRNSFITMMDLKDLSIEDIQELIRHNKFDTRFQYYNDSKDLKHRDFSVINAIQESIIETAKQFKGSINHNNKTAVKYQDVFLSKCADPSMPSYRGAKQLTKNRLCISWDNCLQCKKSQVFLEHLPRICYRIKQYEDMKNIMTVFEWENNFKVKYEVAKNTLKKWVETGGKQSDIDKAWNNVEENRVFLPDIFPVGDISMRKNNEEIIG